MVRARAQPEELAVQHVRQPRERVPVAGVAGGEGPGEPRASEAGAHVGVAAHVVGVVVAHEAVAGHLRVHRECGDGEEHGDSALRPHGGHSSRLPPASSGVGAVGPFERRLGHLGPLNHIPGWTRAKPPRPTG